MINLTVKDLETALEVCKNSIPCVGSLRETAPGNKNAYCVMGCVIAGAARNRKKSFDSIDMMFDYYQLSSRFGDLVHQNDNRFELDSDSKFFANPGAVKQWQMGAIRKMIKKAKQNGGSIKAV